MDIELVTIKKREVTQPDQRYGNVVVHGIPGVRIACKEEIPEITESVSALSLTSSADGRMCPHLLPRGPHRGRPSHFRQYFHESIAGDNCASECPLSGKRRNGYDNNPDVKFSRDWEAGKQAPPVMSTDHIQHWTPLDDCKQHLNQDDGSYNESCRDVIPRDLQDCTVGHLPNHLCPVQPQSQDYLFNEFGTQRRLCDQEKQPSVNNGNLVEQFCTRQSLPEPLCRQDRLLTGPEIQHRLLAGPEIQDRLLVRPEIQDRLFAEPDRQDRLLAGPERQGRLLTGPEIQDRLFAEPDREDRLLAGPVRQDRLLAGPVRQDRLLAGPEIQDRLLAGIEIEDRLLTGIEIQDGLLAGPDKQDRLLAGPEILDRLLERGKVQERLLAGSEIHDRLIEGPDRQDRLLAGPEVQDPSLSQDIPHYLPFGEVLRQEKSCNQQQRGQLKNPNLLPEKLGHLGELEKRSYTLTDPYEKPFIQNDFTKAAHISNVFAVEPMPEQRLAHGNIPEKVIEKYSKLEQQETNFSKNTLLNVSPTKQNAYTIEDLDKILSPLLSDVLDNNKANSSDFSDSIQPQEITNLGNDLHHSQSSLLDTNTTMTAGDTNCRRTRSCGNLPSQNSSYNTGMGQKYSLLRDGDNGTEPWVHSTNDLYTFKTLDNPSQTIEIRQRVLSHDGLDHVHTLIDRNMDRFKEALRFIDKEMNYPEDKRADSQNLASLNSNTANNLQQCHLNASSKETNYITQPFQERTSYNFNNCRNAITGKPVGKTQRHFPKQVKTGSENTMPGNKTPSNNTQSSPTMLQIQNSLGQPIRIPVYPFSPNVIPKTATPLRKILPKTSRVSVDKSTPSSGLCPQQATIIPPGPALAKVTRGVSQSCSSPSNCPVTQSSSIDNQRCLSTGSSKGLLDEGNSGLSLSLSTPSEQKPRLPKHISVECNTVDQKPCRGKGIQLNITGNKVMGVKQLQPPSGQVRELPARDVPPYVTPDGGHQPTQWLTMARRFVAEWKQQNLCCQNKDGDTYLHKAVCWTDCYLVKALLERLYREGLCQQVINKRNNLGQTPLYVAVADNQQMMVRELLQYGADPNCLAVVKWNNGMRKEVKAAIHCAAQGGHLFTATLAELLKAKDIAVNTTNSEGLTALHCAIQEHRKERERHVINSIPVIKMLLQAGADPNVQDGKSGKTPLMYAIETKDYRLVQAMVNLIDKDKLRNMLKTQTFDGSNCGKLCAGLNMHRSDIDNWRKINFLIFSSGS